VSLADDLAHWTDWDVATFHLGRVLGLFAGQDFSTGAKGVFWTDNPPGNGLHDTLPALPARGYWSAGRSPVSGSGGGGKEPDQAPPAGMSGYLGGKGLRYAPVRPALRT
jgi:hypothetical protein